MNTTFSARLQIFKYEYQQHFLPGCKLFSKMDDIKESEELVQILKKCQFTADQWYKLLTYLKLSTDQLRDRDLADTEQVIALLNEAENKSWDLVMYSMKMCDRKIAEQLELSSGKEILIYSALYIYEQNI